MLHAREDYDRIQDPAHKIPPEEPVFLLRAQDQNAWIVVALWGFLNRLRGGDPRLSERAYEQARQMKAWPNKKPADL